MGSFSIWHWLIVLLVVVLIFGTKKLKNIGSDLGGAVKGFKDGMKDGGGPAFATGRLAKDRKGRGRQQHGRRRSEDPLLSATSLRASADLTPQRNRSRPRLA